MYTFDEKEHLHKLDDTLLTGTSTVMGVLAKPLTWWASGLAVGTLGWLNPKTSTPEQCLEKAKSALETIKELEVEEYAKLLNKAYKAHSEKLTSSAEEGTDMHAELEKYVKLMISDQDGKALEMNEGNHKAVIEFAKWAKVHVKKFLWSELYCHSPSYLLGGISDCGAELNDGSIAIIDFKSSKEAYASHYFQIGGYDIQITENGGWTKDGKKVFTLEESITKHIVVPFGAKEVLPIISDLVEDNKQGFLHALGLYRTLNKLNNQ